MNDEAVRFARKLGHPSSLTAALDFSAWLHQLCRDRQGTLDQAEEAIALATEHGFGFWLPMGTILRGWALAEGGEVDDGIAAMRHGLDAFLATRAGIMQPYYLSLIAEAYGKRGQTEQGLRMIGEEKDIANATKEQWWESELYRLQGELLLMDLMPARHPANGRPRNVSNARLILHVSAERGHWSCAPH